MLSLSPLNLSGSDEWAFCDSGGARSLPPTLAAVVAELAPDEVSYVMMSQIRDIAERHGIPSRAVGLA